MNARPDRPAALGFDARNRRVRLDPHEPAFVQDPYRAYAFFHEHARAFFWEDYGLWCLAGFDDVNAFLRDRRFGRERPGGYMSVREGGGRDHLTAFDAIEAGSMLEIEPPAHTRLRTLVNRAFVSRQVERLRPRIEALCHDLVDAIEATGRADIIPAYATPLPITVIAGMLGVPAEEGPRLLEWSHRMVAMYMHGRDRNTEDSAEEAAREFRDFIRAHAAERRKEPRDDLLSLLVSAHDDGDKLSEDELVSSTILLLNAGHEATVHQTGNAIRTVLARGGDPRRFFAPPEATAATIEECLRFDPPLHMFARYAYEEVEIAEGIRVRAGEQVGLLLGAANRDPKAFAAPHLFDPARGGGRHVSFGAGIHFCIGAPLARLELQIALEVLFNRLPGLTPASEPVYRDTYHFHGLERLDCTW